MQCSDMLQHPLQVGVESCFEILTESLHQVPHPGIRIERQAANGNPGYEIASRVEELSYQTLIFGKEQNIAHQAADGIGGGNLIDTVLRALLQKEKSGDWSRAVLARLGQLSGKRSAEGRVPAGAWTHVGNFVGQQGDVRRRQARHRGFACAGYTREQIRAAVATRARRGANRTGGVQQESAARGQNQAVQNAQHRIERIGVGILPHAASSGARVPAGVEVSTLKEPLFAVAANPNVVIRRHPWADEIKLKLKLGRRGAQEPFIALAQKIEEALVTGG